MPFSSGTFTYTTSGLPVVTGTAISSTVENAKNTETATGLTTCLLKDGTQTVTANIPMSSFKFTGLAAGSASGDSLRYEQVNGVVTTAGDLLVASSSGAFRRSPALRMLISGLVQSQAADTDHDTTIAVGGTMDSTNAYWLALASALTKRIDAAWAVGTNNGGLDGTESVAGTPDASTWYYIHLIARSDTGVVDALYSESATAPTMPTNYDFRRLIGCVLTDSSANIIAYDAYELSGGGLEVRWQTPPRDVDLADTLTTSARTDTLSVPTAFSVHVSIWVFASDDAAAESVFVSCPDQADQAPSLTDTPGVTARGAGAASGGWMTLRTRTSATGTIRARASVATMDTYIVVTYSFEWARR